MGDRLWIMPNNDLEAKTIIEMLKKAGENVLSTLQAWGASWEGLEDNIKARIKEEILNNENIKIYGIELQGEAPDNAKNIDHHVYDEEDRSNNKSSIEQVADLLGVKLTIDEMFVAENDKGHISAMKALGAKLGMNEEEINSIIDNIRRRDRETQGITKEQEANAQEAINKLGEIEGKVSLICVEIPESKCAPITDGLYDKYDNLLIIGGDGETNFFGETELINELNEKFPGGWSGGQLDKGSGFWGGYADQNKIKDYIINEFVKKDLPIRNSAGEPDRYNNTTNKEENDLEI
ncbi:MAG: hypothetical protein RSG48_05775 [Clostridia bacterium]